MTYTEIMRIHLCCNKRMRTKKNPMAAVHSATGYSTSKTSFIDSETSGIIWRRHVAKKMPAAKQFKYAITSDLLFDFHQGIYQYIIILECFHSRMNGNKFILWKYYFFGSKNWVVFEWNVRNGTQRGLTQIRTTWVGWVTK